MYAAQLKMFVLERLQPKIVRLQNVSRSFPYKLVPDSTFTIYSLSSVSPLFSSCNSKGSAWEERKINITNKIELFLNINGVRVFRNYSALT